MNFTIKPQVYSKKLSIHSIETIIKAVKHGLVKDKIQQLRELKASGDEAAAKKVKDSLPAVFCGEYHDLNGGTGMDKSFDHNGVIFMDIDKIPEGEAERLKEVIKNSPLFNYVLFAFTSPSGGLKIALRTEYCDTDNDFHKFVYGKLVQLCIKCGLPEAHVDTQVNNQNRATYLSYDPLILIGVSPKAIPVNQWYPEYNKQKEQFDSHYKVRKMVNEHSELNVEYVERYAEKVFQHSLQRMAPGNRHVEIFKLGMTLFKCGVDEMGVANYFMRLKAAGHYTESMTPQAKARDVMSAWDGMIDSKFFKITRQSSANLARAAFASLSPEDMFEADE